MINICMSDDGRMDWTRGWTDGKTGSNETERERGKEKERRKKDMDMK